MSNHSRRDSAIWTPEEIPYIHRIIVYDDAAAPRWATRPHTQDDDDEGFGRGPYTTIDSYRRKMNTQGSQSVPDEGSGLAPNGSMLRLIVLGAPGAGKTAILTRVGCSRQIFSPGTPSADHPPARQWELSRRNHGPSDPAVPASHLARQPGVHH
jgi:hypothetical protein